MEHFGKLLMIIAPLLFILGLLFYFGATFIGKLPGDIVIERENFKFYFPLGTSILISIILSLLFYLFSKK
ncbi:MAG: DUF2905 domain-containing protein [Spirochaetia bacterium]|nr:DUF2905 domain-containing protein [Spirochaetia bacterium]